MTWVISMQLREFADQFVIHHVNLPMQRVNIQTCVNADRDIEKLIQPIVNLFVLSPTTNMSALTEIVLHLINVSVSMIIKRFLPFNATQFVITAQMASVWLREFASAILITRKTTRAFASLSAILNV